MTPRLNARRRDDRQLAGLDPADPLEEAGRTAFRQQGEQLGDADFVRRVGDFGQRVQALGHRGEGEEAGAAMIMERPHPDRIARQDQPARRHVPEGEGIIAEQMGEAILTPFLPGGEQEGGVRHPGRFRPADAERAGQLVAIVEPDIGDQAPAAPTAGERLAVERIFGEAAEQPPAERDVAAVPGRAVMRAVNLLRGEHLAARLGSARPPVIIPAPGQCGHLRPLSPSPAVPR